MKNEMEKDILKVLYSEEEIRARVQDCLLYTSRCV